MKRILISIKNNEVDRFPSKLKHNKFENTPNLILTLILTFKRKDIYFSLNLTTKIFLNLFLKAWMQRYYKYHSPCWRIFINLDSFRVSCLICIISTSTYR